MTQSWLNYKEERTFQVKETWKEYNAVKILKGQCVSAEDKREVRGPVGCVR